MSNSMYKEVVIDGYRYTLDYFTYSINFAALANGATASNQIAISADADFVVQKMSYFATLAGAPQTDSSRVVPLATVQITDSGSGRNLQNEGVFINSIFGQGELPFMLPVPRVFSANSNIKFTVTNVSAADTYESLQLSLIGYKRFLQGRT